MPRPRRWRGSRFVALLAASALVVSTVLVGVASAPALSKRIPLPAGPRPSEIAKMPCQREAQKELAAALGLRGVVADTTWVHHRYSCIYRYSNGTFALSIQEESSWPQTFSYYHSLGSTMGKVRGLANLGQGAFQTTNGSVVVRKDWKVLLVNITGLPARFGVPETSVGDIAVTIAIVILGCWAGD